MPMASDTEFAKSVLAGDSFIRIVADEVLISVKSAVAGDGSLEFE